MTKLIQDVINQAFLEYLPKLDVKGRYQAVHDFQVNFFDPAPLFWTIRQPECDYGSALSIYWLVLSYYDPSKFTQKKQLDRQTEVWLSLIQEIEAKYVQGQFLPSQIAYDPKTDVELARDRFQDFSIIPDIMTQPTKGEQVDCPRDLINGMPQEVHDLAVERVGADRWNMEFEEEEGGYRKTDYADYECDYWIYRQNLKPHGSSLIMSEMAENPRKESDRFVYKYDDQEFSIKNPRQHESFGVDLKQKFITNPKWKHPDWLNGSHFDLFSKPLIELMQDFDVKFEYFPVIMVDKQGNELPEPEYYIFHSLEGIIDAMDYEKSNWKDRETGVPQIILDDSKFEPRPIFLLKHIHVMMMRDDLRREIIKRKLTGFSFLPPALYKNRKYGFPPDYQPMP